MSVLLYKSAIAHMNEKLEGMTAMMNYFETINQIINENSDYDTFLIANRDGYIEYAKCHRSNIKEYHEIEKGLLGKRITDIYPELDDNSSTIMEVLRTGKTVTYPYQSLTWKTGKIITCGKTYPIYNEGVLQGAVEVSKSIVIDFGIDNSDRLYKIDDIITMDDNMKALKNSIINIGRSDSSVLIYGETGTGKELIAESIHSCGLRNNKPFITQNCAAVPEQLVESIFFGTERGSFTGAETKEGIFEMANGGTLFLDEVNSMPPLMQSKLLKAIEEKKVRHIGGNRDINFDVRIICATNEHPSKLLADNIIRKDLYYRISIMNITIPPLKDRGNDVLLLTDYFIAYYNRKMHRNIMGASNAVQNLFSSYNWPGNIRELKNIIESAFNYEKSDYITLSGVKELVERINMNVSDTDGTYTASDRGTPSFMKGDEALSDYLLRIERNIIMETLQEEKQVSRAAKILGMSPQKLEYRMSRLGIKRNNRYE